MSQLVFYRKYRPKNFSEVINQKLTVKILTQAISQERLSHAYIFAGPRGTGKTTFARLLAKAINCEKRKKGDYEPCNQCAACQAINENRALDLIEIDAASNRGIDEIRDWKENIKFPPVHLKYKVFIIDEAHQLTKEAFNALLKTLEEPPPYIIFILATTEPDKLPLTILSRAQRYDFKRLNIDDIVKRLSYIAKEENLKVSPEALKLIAASSAGGLRDAESLLGQLAILHEGKIDLSDVEDLVGTVNFDKIRSFIELLIKKEASQAIKFISELYDNGADLLTFNREILNYLRYLLIIKVSSDLSDLLEKEITLDEIKIIKEQANRLELLDIKRWLDIFLNSQNSLKYSPVLTLPLELAVVESIFKEKV